MITFFSVKGPTGNKVIASKLKLTELLVIPVEMLTS